VEVAPVVIKCDAVLAVICSHIQVAIGFIVTVWLTILCAAEPPFRAISCAPRLLLSDTRVHGMICASTTTVRGICDIDNEVWSIEWFGRSKESLPIIAGGW
jgi:hypothetical protein